MVSSVLFIVSTFLSFTFFVWIFFQIKKQQKMYKLPQKLSLNCRHKFFKKRYILMLYLMCLTLVFVFGLFVFLNNNL